MKPDYPSVAKPFTSANICNRGFTISAAHECSAEHYAITAVDVDCAAWCTVFYRASLLIGGLLALYLTCIARFGPPDAKKAS
jgi:hypothetical protein